MVATALLQNPAAWFQLNTPVEFGRCVGWVNSPWGGSINAVQRYACQICRWKCSAWAGNFMTLVRWCLSDVENYETLKEPRNSFCLRKRRRQPKMMQLKQHVQVGCLAEVGSEWQQISLSESTDTGEATSDWSQWVTVPLFLESLALVQYTQYTIPFTGHQSRLSRRVSGLDTFGNLLFCHFISVISVSYLNKMCVYPDIHHISYIFRCFAMFRLCQALPFVPPDVWARAALVFALGSGSSQSIACRCNWLCDMFDFTGVWKKT